MISFDRGLSLFQGKRRAERGTHNQAGKENRSKTHAANRWEGETTRWNGTETRGKESRNIREGTCGEGWGKRV